MARQMSHKGFDWFVAIHVEVKELNEAKHSSAVNAGAKELRRLQDDQGRPLLMEDTASSKESTSLEGILLIKSPQSAGGDAAAAIVC